MATADPVTFSDADEVPVSVGLVATVIWPPVPVQVIGAPPVGVTVDVAGKDRMSATATLASGPPEMLYCRMSVAPAKAGATAKPPVKASTAADTADRRRIMRRGDGGWERVRSGTDTTTLPSGTEAGKPARAADRGPGTGLIQNPDMSAPVCCNAGGVSVSRHAAARRS